MRQTLYEKKKQIAAYTPNNETRQYIRKVYNQFTNAQYLRKRPYRILNDRTLDEYWQESEERWLGLVPKKRRRPWQSAVVKPITRIKCVGIIANLLDSMIKPEFFAQKYSGETNTIVSDVISDLYDLSRDQERAEKKYMQFLVDTVSKGVGFMQENYSTRKCKKKDIENFDPLTGEVKTKEREVLEFDGPESEVVSPYEMYLGNIFEEDIQRQPYIFRRVLFSQEDFLNRFGKYRDASKVKAGNYTLLGSDEEEGFYYESQDTLDVDDNLVEVLFYWNKQMDEIAIIANGVLLTEIGTPIPYVHKKYPFVKAIYEPMSNRFAYGKSLPDRLRAEQDVIDTLYRMVIDKTFLSIMPPLLAKGESRVTPDIVEPGRITPIDSEDDVTSIPGVANGVGNEVQVLNMVQNSMSESSIDQHHLGQMAGGERSATQVMEAKQGAERVLGLFAHMVSFALEDQAQLRAQNILQFWAKHERYVMRDGDMEAVRTVFEVPDRVLPNGETGTRLIEFLPAELQDTPERIREAEEERRADGKKVEILQLDPDKIREFNLYARVKASPSDRMSPALRKALDMEFYNTFAENPYMDPQKLTRETIRSFDKNPDDLMKQAEVVPEAAEVEGGANQGNITSQMQAMAQPQLQALIQQ